MEILLVAATPPEIAPLMGNLISAGTGFRYRWHDTGVLITGAGMVATAYKLGRQLHQKRYDLVINVGVCGCFHESIQKGTVVNVISDHFPELGAEDGNNFMTWYSMGIEGQDSMPFRKGMLVNDGYPVTDSVEDLPKMKGITVNTVHGNRKSIDFIKSRYDPDTESMEGAAFFYACLSEPVPCLQIRAVSNFIEERNRDAWNIPLAIQNLNEKIIDILNEL